MGCGGMVPKWLKLPSSEWPKQSSLPDVDPSGEEREVCVHATTQQREPLIPLDRYSNLTQLKYVTAWVFRFANNCRVRRDQRDTLPHLSVQEVLRAETYWLVFSHEERFGEEIDALKTNQVLSKSS